MNTLTPSAYYQETASAFPAVATTITAPNFRYQPSLYTPDTDFRSPFQRTMTKIRRGVERIVNSVTGAAVWAPVGMVLGTTTAVVASTLTASPMPLLPWLKGGAIVGGLKGIFAGNKWFNKAETENYGRKIAQEKLVSQRIKNMTADVGFDHTQLANESQMLNNEILRDELRLRRDQDPYLIELQKRESELKVAKMEQEQAETFSNTFGETKQKNYFAELDVMAA